MSSLFIRVGLSLVIACGGTALQVRALPAPVPAPAPVSSPAPASSTTVASWAPDALEQLLAPVALYPDQLLGQILSASVNSQEVLDAGNWLLQNQSLKGNALDTAAQQAGFGPAMRALIPFPTIIDMMCQQIDWTRQVGSAFTSNQQAVLAAVQRLRAQAAKVGNLKSTPEQKVETKTEGGTTIIEVKPADPQIVYVPQYSPEVVYTTPPSTTVVTQESSDSTETAVASGLLGFGVGVLLGSAFNDHDDCCYPNWGAGAVYVGPRAFYPPAYAYRPAYGAGFRPAYGYRSPAGYRNRYNNGVNNAVRGNRVGNVNINNSNYFNQFNGNQNLRNRAQGNPAQSWRGQLSYAGARDSAQSQRLAQAAGNTSRSGLGGPGSAGAGRDLGGSAGINRGQGPNLTGSGLGAGRRYDRGYGRSGDPGGSPGTGVGRGSASRPGSDSSRMQSRSGAFSGGADGGRFGSAASARGRASAGPSRGAARAGGRGGRRR